MSSLPLVRIWLLISALASVAGWTLSALGELNRAGYAAFGAGVTVLLLLCPKDWQTWSARFCWAKVKRRFRCWLPASFAVLALLAFLGGLIYPPTNHAGLTYRTARVLQWLTAGHWFWIHTLNYRMNDRSCDFEWLTTPLLLFTRSDRALFLLNAFPFLLLPGLVFSLFRRLGVRPRVAWYWMWLLPTGYTFLLQAGSIGNDTFPTVYALAAVDFGLRAWKSRRLSDFWFSVLAAALMTGAKPSNLPLLLPWAILMLGLLPMLKRRPLATAGVVAVALLVSFAPSAILNVIHCGDWSGLKLERPGMNMQNPFVGIWGNTFLFLLDNLAPPFFPQAASWNHSALRILPHAMVAPMVANFENGFYMLWELPSEDWAGLGFGLTLLLLISFAATFHTKGRSAGTGPPWRWREMIGDFAKGRLSPGIRWLMLASPWVALLAYCVKSGMVTGARLISPYYPFLIPAILVRPGQSGLVRRRRWKALAGGVVAIAFPVLILTPARPLWPAHAVLSRLLALRPQSRLLQRALTVYAVYDDRSDPLAEVRALLPKGLKVVGFMADGDDMDISLWRPYFSRRVKGILLSDSGAEIRRRGIKYAVVGGAHLNAMHVRLADWLRRTDARVVAETTATIKVVEGPQKWYVVQFLPPPTG